MYANLAGQQAECVFSIYAKGRGLDPSFLAWLIVVEDRLKSLALGPAHVHAHQHFRPVLRFCSTRARMNRYDGVAWIVFTRKQSFSFQTVNAFAKRIHLAADVAFDILAFARQIEVCGDVLRAAEKVTLGREHVFEALLLAHDLLGPSWIRPEVRVGGLLFNFS